MNRLSIYVDESGDFGFINQSSILYIVSFVFYDNKYNINKEINALNGRLKKIGYSEMIHMANLICNREEYRLFSIDKRKSIFNALYQFTKKVPINYFSIIIRKDYINNKIQLRKKIEGVINDIINENRDYFKKFKEVILYYDNGQKYLGKLLERTFNKFDNFRHIKDFDHKEERLFQVADMLTYLDKFYYQYNNKIYIKKNEQYFFTKEKLKDIMKNLDKKRMN